MQSQTSHFLHCVRIMDEHWLPAQRRFRFPGTLWTKWFLPSILLCDSFGRIDGFLPFAVLIIFAYLSSRLVLGWRCKDFIIVSNRFLRMTSYTAWFCKSFPSDQNIALLENLLYPDTISIPRNTFISSSLMLGSGQLFETLYNLLCSTICLKIWSSRNNSNSSTGSKLAYLSYCTFGKASGEGIWDSLLVHFKLTVLRRFFEVGAIASSESLSQEPLRLPVCWNSHSARSWFLAILAGVKLFSQQACNQLRTPGGVESFLRVAQISQTMPNTFKLCPTYFSRGEKDFLGGRSS